MYVISPVILILLPLFFKFLSGAYPKMYVCIGGGVRTSENLGEGVTPQKLISFDSFVNCIVVILFLFCFCVFCFWLVCFLFCYL